MNEPFERSTWFAKSKALEYISTYFPFGKKEIRIATGFFTIRGWGLVRKYTLGKQVYLLVGIDDPGEERARKALIDEIMRDLRTGLDKDRRQVVLDLVQKMQQGKLHLVDARAMDHHNKLFIVDRTVAIQASANLTGRGLMEQVEGGCVITEKREVLALVKEFDDYFAVARDITLELLEELQDWLNFVQPWDVYLKTMLALEDIQPAKTRYPKQPVSYQVDMIAQTLRQIREYGGSMLVASTGLGKTVVAVHVAIHLRQEDIIDNAIVVCPVAVRSIWKNEMREAGIHSDYFTLSALDQKNADYDRSLTDFEEILQNINDSGRYFLIFDESHKLRRRYSDEWRNKRRDKAERLAFTRLRSLVESGNLKVLLLSGSPYGRDIDDINTQLLLLPHTAESNALLPDFVEDSRAWRINIPEEFIVLPVTSQLTTPHVAKYYGQTDSQGIYIDFGGQKRYIPKVRLHSIYSPLPFEKDLISVINDGYFDLKTRHPIYKKNIETQIKTSWASSPSALLILLERVVDTPGGLNEFDFSKKKTSEFIVSKAERQETLVPVITKLKALSFQLDIKLQTLVKLIDEFSSNQQKVIVFCERLPTAVYIEEGLTQLIPTLRVFCTITKSDPNKIDSYQTKEVIDIEEAIAKFAPQANNAIGKYKDTYDVFIATDAYGIGVSMQDATVVVNYDIAWTPIEPIQRAGRILRFWDSPRTVQLYTFIPKLSINDNLNLRYELSDVEQRWENLMERNSQSRKLIDLPVLTNKTMQDIYMPDVASSQTVVMESGDLKLDKAEDQDVSPYYKHTAQLQLNRDYAKNINNDIVSAKTYQGKYPLIYVLLNHQGKYYWTLYDSQSEQLRSPTVVKLLELISCTEDTQVATVNYDTVEQLSYICIQKWCDQNVVSPDDVERICVLYLKPDLEGDDVHDWLNLSS